MKLFEKQALTPFWKPILVSKCSEQKIMNYYVEKYFDYESSTYAKLKKPLKQVRATIWKPILVKIASLTSLMSCMHSI